MSERDTITDIANVRSRTAAIAAEPGMIAIENVGGVLKQVDDQGTVTALGGGGGTGTVTSVAATASGLLAVAGTPTVAPTVGMATMADQRVVGNVSGGVAVPIALTAAQVRTMLAVQDSSAVAITGGTIAGVGISGAAITASTLNMGGNSIFGATAANGTLTLRGSSGATPGPVILGNNVLSVGDSTGYLRIGSVATAVTPLEIDINLASAIDIQGSATATKYINRTGSSTSSLGFVTTGSASSFVFYPGNVTKSLEMLIASGVVKVGFFAAAPVAQQTVGANVNNVAASGTTGQFDDFTNGSVYATDYAALHATVYQLTRSVAQLTVAVRNLGFGA